MDKQTVFGIVKKNILEILPELDGNAIEIHMQLKDLGANSIDRVDIVTMSMEDLDVHITAMELRKISNIEGLVELLLEKAS